MHVLMCRPSYFDVNYKINPWMSGNISQSKAFTQWHNLLKTYQNLSIKVSVIEQEKNLSDMVFTTDCGVVYKNVYIPSNFKYPQRKLEIYSFTNWFSKNKFKIIFTNKNFKFEGGDFLFWNNFILAGTGFRTDPKAVFKIAKILNIKLISLKLINKYYYHLDTCLLPINKKIIFYYPPAFSQESQKVLKNLVPNLIPISKKITNSFALNSLVYKKNIICQKAIYLKKDFMKLGYNVYEEDLSEFKKAGGGIHCLTKIIN